MNDSGEITAVEPDSSAESGDTVLTQQVLLPAPCNLHSHAFQRALAGRNQRRGASEDSFWSWRELMYRFLDHLTPEDVFAISAQAQMEMAEAGYCAVAEFHYVHHDPAGKPYANLAEMSTQVCEAATQTGIGLTLLPVLYNAAGADGRPAEGGQRRFACDADRYTTLWDAAASGVKAGASDWGIGIAPHSLRAVPRPLLKDVVAKHADVPIHIHIAEQTAEVEEIRSSWGARPVAWLLDNHAVDHRWCLIHATHIDASECAGLASSGATAGLCPVTEADLGDGIFPGLAYLQHGGKLGVGTDSNVAVSFNTELRMLEYSQRLAEHRRNVLGLPETSTGRTLFDATVSGGAQALGRNTGEIAQGKLADLVTLDLEATTLFGLTEDELLDGWIFSSGENVVQNVWSAGRWLVKDGQHIAKELIATNYKAALTSLLARA